MALARAGRQHRTSSTVFSTGDDACAPWARGGLGDITALQGPECTEHPGTTLPAATVAVYLRSERAALAQHFGRRLRAIGIRGVDVRNVGRTKGEAVVEYDLPAAVAGNDNWVTYAIHDGRWKVADCHAPIGGSSATKTTDRQSTTTSRP